jgi:hypothetical protein
MTKRFTWLRGRAQGYQRAVHIRRPAMSDTSRADDPLEGPDAAPAPGSQPQGGVLRHTTPAENGEQVLDPDAEGEGPEHDAAAEVERREGSGPG